MATDLQTATKKTDDPTKFYPDQLLNHDKANCNYLKFVLIK